MTTLETTQKPRRFYQTMAWVFVAIAFGGFIPTYWLKLMDGSFGGKPKPTACNSSPNTKPSASNSFANALLLSSNNWGQIQIV